MASTVSWGGQKPWHYYESKSNWRQPGILRWRWGLRESSAGGLGGGESETSSGMSRLGGWAVPGWGASSSELEAGGGAGLSMSTWTKRRPVVPIATP